MQCRVSDDRELHDGAGTNNSCLPDTDRSVTLNPSGETIIQEIPLRIIDQKMLDQLTSEAQASPRRRKNLNFHPGDDFCCHRLLNAMEPDSYIRPHRHMDPLKDESMVMVRGRMGVLIFDHAGNVVRQTIIAAADDAVAVDIPHGLFHTVVGLESGTVFFESKAGPYHPLTDEEKGGWSPAEGTEEAAP
jgi:cupin fold WbuC family metalloprotein